MELSFTNVGNEYVATAEVNADYNLHIESDRMIDIVVRQKTAGNAYAVVAAGNYTVMDDDFDGVVYPKTIKVSASKEPTLAIITEMQ